MGIATAIVSSWESGASTPDSQQMTLLATVLGFDAKR
jgi:DNA-binding transcriptional regulator YiaG